VRRSSTRPGLVLGYGALAPSTSEHGVRVLAAAAERLGQANVGADDSAA
jgi:hypothetical protein